jgi:hypothetical protein
MTKEYKKWLAKLDFIQKEYEFGPFRILRDATGEMHDRKGQPSYVSPTRITQYQNGRKHGIDVDTYGTICYFFKGVQVPRKYILEPESLTYEEVMTHANAEVRRVGIEIYGFDRLIEEKKLRCIHKDKDTGAGLYQMKIGDLVIQVVRVLDGTPMTDGTRKVYFLQVPPTMTTCKQAIAWTFRKEPDDYNPDIET